MVLGFARRHQILSTWQALKSPCRHKWVRGKQDGNATRIYDQWTREDNTGLAAKDIKLATAAMVTRLGLKCDGTRAETRFRLSAKRTSVGRQFSRLLAAEVCASAVEMLDIPCSEVVWRVLATHSIRQFPFHFSSLGSPRVVTFQLDSTFRWRTSVEEDQDRQCKLRTT